MLFSAEDLLRFTGCTRATWLDLQAGAAGLGLLPDPLALSRVSHDLRAAGLVVCEISGGPDLATAALATAQALATGADAVTGAAFLAGDRGCRTDVLLRVDQPSQLGDFSYEVVDIANKATIEPADVLRLVLASDLLAEQQGWLPELARVRQADGRDVPLRLADYAHYARSAWARLAEFSAAPAAQPPRAVPCSDCATCHHATACSQVWAAEDSLFTVAGISRVQVKKLESAGVNTLTALADLTQTVPGLGPDTQSRLGAQARLQQARKTGSPHYELRLPEPGRGFALLPEPQAGDLFWLTSATAQLIATAGQCHRFDVADPAVMLSELLDFLRQKLPSGSLPRIYHFGAAELSSLRRLTTTHGQGEALLDRLLREGRFVDLLAVLRGGVICSEAEYSLPALAVYTDPDGTPSTGQDADCRALQRLRDWLVRIRPVDAWAAASDDAGEQEAVEDAQTADLRALLDSADMPPDRRELLFNLGFFHKREAKPAQWAVFESTSKDEDALIGDLDALAGLRACAPVVPVKRSFAREYRYPAQETKLRAGKKASVPVFNAPPSTVSIEALDRRARRVTIKVGPGKAHLLADRLSLHPDWPLDTKVLAQALRDVITDQCGPRRYRAVDDLLSRAAPRLQTGPLGPLADLISGTVAAVTAMEETVLPIQGPPGTGKTYVTARAILALLRQGARVGVSSNSHEAIRNVLSGVSEAADLPFPIDIVHKISGDDDGYAPDSPVRRTGSNEVASAGQHLVGATAWFFTRDENIQAFDWLFVDEAGQVGLANMAAMGRAARNIVLVGDPRQLPQVIQGAHPPPADQSCLDWMLGENATLPADRGIFLPLSRRMHPQICDYISDQIYGGRLESHADTARQAICGTPYPAAGAYWVPVAHEGNAQICPEEICAIKDAVTALLRGSWQDKTSTIRALQPADIIVVAPYNAQVNALRDALPAAIRVGTVDKFQGQEAPVCLVSMTASSAAETARGMEFLFSLNRINVAVSRAKGLAMIFGAPRLREAKCETIDQMRLVNAICALPDLPVVTAVG